MVDTVFKKAETLKKIVDSVKDLVSESLINFDQNGMTMQTMDKAHVALLYLELNSTGFESFKCDIPCTIGISIENLATILKFAGQNDILAMVKDSPTDELKFAFTSTDKETEVALKLMDIETEIFEIPDIKYKTIVYMPSSELSRITRDLQAIGETVEIKVTENAVSFVVNGDIGKVNVAVKVCDNVRIKYLSDTRLVVSLKYLHLFTKASSLSDEVIICMNELEPLAIKYKIKDIGKISFYLAPKMDD